MADPGFKILMVITTLDTGGAEKHLYLLSRELLARGHRPDLVYLKGEGSLARDFEGLGMAVEKIPLESPAHLPGAVLRLAKKIRAGGYGGVHSHLLKADLVSALACARCRPVTLIASKHNDERALLNPVYSRVHGLISRAAKRVIVLSGHVARFVEHHGRVPRAKIRTIYYGLDLDTFRADPAAVARVREELDLKPDVPVMTMVARFAPQKDHATLLAAARILEKRGRSFRLLLVGDDPFGDGRRKIETQCRAARLGDRVIFTGVRRDVPAILGATDLFVMPSLWEGLGLVFLEAMAFSLPVVANRVSAIPEIVVHGETGLLVEPGDPEALASAIEELLFHPERSADFGRRGLDRLKKHFSIKEMVDRTEQVYRECGIPSRGRETR
jgi:glycosyltransferase involved in cell wall biosynthesis